MRCASGQLRVLAQVRSVFETYQRERLIVNSTRTFLEMGKPIGAKGWCVGRWNTTALERIGHNMPADPACSKSLGKEWCPWAELCPGLSECGSLGARARPQL